MDHIIIIGKTVNDAVFRPSDWCSRLAGSTSCFGNNKRLQYHNYITPVWIEGIAVPALKVDKRLQTKDPSLYNHIMAFAISNNLRIDYGKETVKEESRSLGSFKKRATSPV